MILACIVELTGLTLNNFNFLCWRRPILDAMAGKYVSIALYGRWGESITFFEKMLLLYQSTANRSETGRDLDGSVVNDNQRWILIPNLGNLRFGLYRQKKVKYENDRWRERPTKFEYGLLDISLAALIK